MFASLVLIWFSLSSFLGVLGFFFEGFHVLFLNRVYLWFCSRVGAKSYLRTGFIKSHSFGKDVNPNCGFLGKAIKLPTFFWVFGRLMHCGGF